jgi:hypothetical protein
MPPLLTRTCGGKDKLDYRTGTPRTVGRPAKQDKSQAPVGNDRSD